VTETASDKPADISDIEKSAVVMMSVGQDAAAEVVKYLSQPELNRLSMAMARICNVPKNTALSVLQEFADLMLTESSIGVGSFRPATLAIMPRCAGIGPEGWITVWRTQE
jgi:flagellar motor switch protein FliG